MKTAFTLFVLTFHMGTVSEKNTGVQFQSQGHCQDAEKALQQRYDNSALKSAAIHVFRCKKAPSTPNKGEGNE